MKKFKELKESKYGDAMSSRLPSHLDDPRVEAEKKPKPKTGAPSYSIKIPKPKRGYGYRPLPLKEESTWNLYRESALLESVLDVPTSSPEAIAKKHEVSVEDIRAQLAKGTEVEKEHTSNLRQAREIALDHLGENPEYYTKLSKAKLEESLKENSMLNKAEGYKVGDKVKPNIGPHKGIVHTVIHVHSTGHLNIKPDIHVSKNRYKLGAAQAKPEDVSRHMEDSTLLAGREEKPMPKKSANEMKPKTGTGINRKTIQEIFQAAKDKMSAQNLPTEGANDQTKEVPGAPAPTAKKDNTPTPEGGKKKQEVKGSGVDDKFQADPTFTSLSRMPDTAIPRR